jgi:NhaP-type Na+/H+ or K+/H+ antiporter
VTPSERGRLAVVLLTAFVVICALAIRLILSDGAPDFIAGVLVGIPIGAILGWLADQSLMRLVDSYTRRLRGR